MTPGAMSAIKGRGHAREPLKRRAREAIAPPLFGVE